MTWTFIMAAWLVGFAASCGSMAKLGERNPDTIGDSFTGDDTLDMVWAACWPISWPCFAAYKLAQAAVR